MSTTPKTPHNRPANTGLGGVKVVVNYAPRLFRPVLEQAVAAAALLFVFFAFEKFLPSTSGIVEAKAAAAGALFIALIKSF